MFDSADIQDEVSFAKTRLVHGCDGPITAFVLISRATALAVEMAQRECQPGNREAYSKFVGTIIANALDEALAEYGYLSNEDVIYPTGS